MISPGTALPVAREAGVVYTKPWVVELDGVSTGSRLTSIEN
jgi:hypothetical protein